MFNKFVFSDWEIKKAPTCSETGRQKRSSISGGEQTQTDTIPAVGHNFRLIQTTEATCTQAGKLIYKCSLCGESRTESFGESLGHSHIETITKSSTCAEGGMTQFTCVQCGDSYEKEIPQRGHDYGEWIVSVSVEEGVEGKQYRECNICGDKTWETISALPKTDMPFQFGMLEILVTSGNILLLIIVFCTLLGELKLAGMTNMTHLMLILNRLPAKKLFQIM